MSDQPTSELALLWTKAQVDAWLLEQGAPEDDTRYALALVLASEIVYDYEAQLDLLRIQLGGQIQHVLGYQVAYGAMIDERDSLEAKIAVLEAQLIVVSRELTSTGNADRYYRGFNDGHDIGYAAGKKEA